MIIIKDIKDSLVFGFQLIEGKGYGFLQSSQNLGFLTATAFPVLYDFNCVKIVCVSIQVVMFPSSLLQRLFALYQSLSKRLVMTLQSTQ